MTIDCERQIFTELAATEALALTANGSLLEQSLLYAQTTAPLATTAQFPVPITGLAFALPAHTAAYGSAIVTLSLPDLYLTGPGLRGRSLGGVVYVKVDGVVAAERRISAKALSGGAGNCRKPMTIVVKIELDSTAQRVEAAWQGIRNSTITMDDFGCISAMLLKTE